MKVFVITSTANKNFESFFASMQSAEKWIDNMERFSGTKYSVHDYEIRDTEAAFVVVSKLGGAVPKFENVFPCMETAEKWVNEMYDRSFDKREYVIKRFELV